MDSDFYIGADLGQSNDYTAITIVQRPFTSVNESERPYYLRHVERPALGTPYPAIVERLRELSHSRELSGGRRTVVVDYTGIGRPVWDMMQRTGFNAELTGILITGGSAVTRDGSIFHTPKRDLIMALLVALQNGQLRIAKGLPLADVLVKELLNFKVRISESGTDRYEAVRESAHDDLVLSASMAVWMASQPGRHILISKTFRLYGDPPSDDYPSYIL